MRKCTALSSKRIPSRGELENQSVHEQCDPSWPESPEPDGKVLGWKLGPRRFFLHFILKFTGNLLHNVIYSSKGNYMLCQKVHFAFFTLVFVNF